MKNRISIWMAFVSFIFMVLLTTVLLSIFLYVMASRLDMSRPHGLLPLHILVFIMFISLIFGTIMSAFFIKKMMKFVYDLRDATRRVATGDFSVRIDENRAIHEVSRLIQDFNKMVRELDSIEILKDDFITSVSHEIKTPIAAIEGCVELLKDHSLTKEEADEYINIIDIGVTRLSVLTANILRLSRLDNQEILLDRTEFSLDEQIRQAILLLEHKWSEKDINLNIHLTPTSIYANKELLMLVWINLIDNAVKFSETGSDIGIELTVMGGQACVHVRDNGIGMAVETIKHIFQKFYQGNVSRSDQGNGLGLALADRIVCLSGGEIRVESRLGEGSVFSVDLPLAR